MCEYLGMGFEKMAFCSFDLFIIFSPMIIGVACAMFAPSFIAYVRGRTTDVWHQEVREMETKAARSYFEAFHHGLNRSECEGVMLTVVESAKKLKRDNPALQAYDHRPLLVKLETRCFGGYSG